MVTVERIVDIFRNVSLAHNDIKEFYYGSSYDVAISLKTQYPIVFLETPFNIAYDNNRKFKTFTFAISVLLKTKQDSVVENIKAISIGEDINDAIISKIQNDFKSEILISNVNALSLENFSDDHLGGVRTQLTVTVIRDYTTPVCYEDKFSDCEDC
jgi:hypothetical protein